MLARRTYQAPEDSTSRDTKTGFLPARWPKVLQGPTKTESLRSRSCRRNEIRSFPWCSWTHSNLSCAPVTFSLWWMCLFRCELHLSHWVLAHKSRLNPGAAERLVPWRRQGQAYALPSSYLPVLRAYNS